MIMPVDIKLAFKYKENTYKMIMSDVDAKVKKLFPTVRKSFFYIRNIMFKLKQYYYEMHEIHEILSITIYHCHLVS